MWSSSRGSSSKGSSSKGSSSRGSSSKIPRHVGIIMDGNSRWAKRHNVALIEGHRRGAEALRETVKAAVGMGIKYLTVFGFSSENWNRPRAEIEALMKLMRFYLKQELDYLEKENIRVQVIGDISRFEADILALIKELETRTSKNDRLRLTVALSYGGRDDILSACRDLACRYKNQEIGLADIDEKNFSSSLSTFPLGDPDLLIRTSGERRLSNFMLWEIAYSELYFTDKLWPDFTSEDFSASINEYLHRERRYGRHD